MKNDDIHDLMDQVFKPKTPTDIVKGVAYDRGVGRLGSETKYATLVAMVILSDQPIVSKEEPEIVFMGATNGLADRINSIEKFKCPYKFGDISHGITAVSEMSPNDLEKL